MAAVDDLLLPWQVDLVLRHELPADLEAHLQRVGLEIGRCSGEFRWGVKRRQSPPLSRPETPGRAAAVTPAQSLGSRAAAASRAAGPQPRR